MKEKFSNETWNPHLSFGSLIMAVASEVSKQGKREMRKNRLGHLSYGRVGVLALLLQSPLTQAELAQKLGQKPPSMMEMLEGLEQEGLIQYTPDLQDKRKFDWSLTKKGKKDALEAKNLLRTVGKELDQFFKENKIGEKEIERFKEILLLLLRKNFKRDF